MTSPFFGKPVVAENDLAFALRDAFPVSPGHTLVVPKRLIATWFDATEAEQHALLRLVDEVRRQLDAELHPDGYNIGWNVAEAAGQTVMHLHVHVIPRYHGDVADPRGGVRHVIPGKGNYLAQDFAPAGPRREALATGGADDPFLHHLQPLFAKAQDIAILAAFVQHKGVEELAPLVLAAADRGARVRLITGDYLHITQKEALEALLGWMARDAEPGTPFCAPEVRVVETERLTTTHRSFHPKSWIFVGSAFGTAFVGSSNVSRAALRDGIEWNLRLDRSRDRLGFQRVIEAFETWWQAARPLDPAFLRTYRDRVHAAGDLPPPGEVATEPLEAPPQPHAIQRQALVALQASREAGRARALVVLATGLGKTWLAAFDLQAMAGQLGRLPRLLFLAHRDELLRQAAATFARQFPQADKGFFAGSQADLEATFVFASVQKLSLAAHLPRLAGQAFDYVVVDEVHHATADSYRRILRELRATFVLGLTATPDRMDQADVLGLFDDHLAFRADLGVGIQAQYLAPFHYFGLQDPTNYQPIPWRNGRFDPATLASAVQTQARMDKAWQGWQDHPAQRTLVFCCTIPHARFVRDWLADKGVRVAAVHSEADSADRTDALDQLRRGALDAVCAVDLFNEGIDVPAIDRVVLLRPSESPVVFLQQLGRGLRKVAGKDRLTVLDFVGNHRVFLDRLRTLLDTRPAGAPPVTLAAWLADAARRSATVLPPGCAIHLDVEAIDLLAAMLPRADKNAIVQTFRELVRTRGTRPTAGELYRLGLNPRVKGGWFAFVAGEGQLQPDEALAFEQATAWLTDLESTPMTKSFKMVTLQVLIEADALATGMPVDELCQRAHALLMRAPELFRELADVKDLPDPRQPDPAVWRKYWRKNPIAAWLGESADKQKKAWFALEDDRFVPRFRVADAAKPALTRLVAEVVDWRLAEYRARGKTAVLLEATAFECKLIHNDQAPILKLPDRAKVPRVPEGDTSVRLPDGRVWTFRFVKVACNVATVPGDGVNRLPELLRGWFGPRAGLPGTNHRVRFRPTPEGWRIEPVAVGEAQVIPFPLRTRVPAFASLRAAAGWQGTTVDGRDLAPDAFVDLPGEVPPGCFAVRAAGTSMEGWRAEIRDGDWLVCKPLEGAGFGSVEGQVAVVARGEPEARTFHVKRVSRDAQGWWLRSDNPAVAALAVEAGDVPVAAVLRVVRAEDVDAGGEAEA